MTRERYFEDCEATGSEPVDSEIPVSQSELSENSLEALTIFNACPDNWEGMSGSYLGKRIECLPALFDIYQIEQIDHRQIFELFKIIETEYYKYTQQQQKAAQRQETKSGSKTHDND